MSTLKRDTHRPAGLCIVTSRITTGYLAITIWHGDKPSASVHPNNSLVGSNAAAHDTGKYHGVPPMKNCVRFASAAAMLLAWASAHAAFYCVNTPLALAIALNQAQNNGQADDIELEVGTYNLGGELQYFAAAGETYDLTISGGAEPGTGCFVRASSGASVLDGQNAVRQLYIDAHGRVNISNLTFQNGHPTQYAGGALNLTAPTAEVESNIFISNHAASGNYGSAAYVASTNAIYFNSNLVFANLGPTALWFSADYVADVNNNTIVANQPASGSAIGALNPIGAGHYNLSNNILWNNSNSDVFDQSTGGTDYFHNDVGVIANNAPHSEVGDISVDPMFNGFLSTRLAPSSPLVNAGIDSPLGGTGATDAGGDTRKIGKHVDIGAFESDVLFRDGFQ
jgi:hypothetical protein